LGKITEIGESQGTTTYMGDFLRMKSRDSGTTTFRFPDARDLSSFQFGQIIGCCQPPTVNRRGLFVFEVDALQWKNL